MRPKERRYSFEPVDFHRGDSDLGALAERLGLKVGTVGGWRRTGLSEDQADRCAVALGMSPYELWPEMLDRAIEEHARLCETCRLPLSGRSDKRFCNRTCREAHPDIQAAIREQTNARYRARYERDREWREARLKKRRETYAANPRPELIKQRLRDAARRAA